jgi:hypothetical protein
LLYGFLYHLVTGESGNGIFVDAFNGGRRHEQRFDIQPAPGEDNGNLVQQPYHVFRKDGDSVQFH